MSLYVIDEESARIVDNAMMELFMFDIPEFGISIEVNSNRFNPMIVHMRDKWIKVNI